MRRALAISLLWLFSLALIAPLFAPDAAAANLPACCRRMGSHHCGMSADTGSQRGLHIDIVAEKCPCTPAVTATFHLTVVAASPGCAQFAEVVSHPANHAQTTARYRISFDRSRQKRGPPAFFFL